MYTKSEPKNDTAKLAIHINVSIFIYANLLNTDDLILLCMCEVWGNYIKS